MNEVRALIEAFDAANRAGERCALATVVSVEGSSYRRPGARMLVREGGASTGTISAGCLEGDVAAHARRAIEDGAAKLVEYDTASTGDEIVWGLGLGCNGIVRVLVEPLSSQSLYVEALRRSCVSTQSITPVAVATVFHHTSSDTTDTTPRIKIGSRLFVNEDGETVLDNLGGDPGRTIAPTIESDVRAFAREEASGVRVYEREGATTKVFVETLLPPVPLVVFGAGHDALPIVELARGLGWQTEVVDPQARPASRARFAGADRVTLARPAEVGARVAITPRTLALLMTHNYEHDLGLLGFLLASPARYVGVMGPRKRTERMLRELAGGDEGHRPEEADRSRLYAPAGLDIGANSPAEIALSIVAEMRAVLEGRGGGMLRERRGSIHGRLGDGEGVPVLEVDAHPSATA